LKRTNKKLPPGSLGLPFLGEALAYARSPHTFFETRANKYGSVFKTRILGSNVVCFVGSEPFSFFVDNPHFARDGAAPPHVQKLLCQQSLPLIDGPGHAAMRQKVAQVFKPAAIESYLAIIERVFTQHAKRWADKAEFRWVDEYRQLSASVCASLLLGAEPGVDNNDGLSELMDEFMAGLTAFPVNLRWTAFGRAIRRRDQLLSMIDSAIAEHRASARDDMLSRLIDARDSHGAPLSGSELRAQVVHLFFAAYGGLFRVLSLMSMNLAQHPEVRQQAEEEVRVIAGSGPLTIDVLLRLRYLDAVTREVRRHNRIFASNFFDKVTQDSEYGGFTVPAGWKATGAIYQTMQDEATFTDPGRFDPGRFSAERHEGQNRPNSYIPHGGGAPTGHRCPAEDLATLIMLQAGAILLRDYQWELSPGQDLALDNHPSPLPRDGIRVTFQRRS
jgi:cytochrome P450